ncbi:MAG: hypothetical protein FWD65_08140 [Coriobacteriia bacterium]|nr:hypothetical protein [Coriobacteriia bacterium]
MKKAVLFALVLVLALALAACKAGSMIGFGGGGSGATSGSTGGSGGGTGGGGGSAPPGETTGGPKDTIPPNCIWTLTGTVKGSKDVGADQGAPGMIEDYQFDIQFDNLSSSYPSGKYTGSIYVKAHVDSSQFFKNMFGKAPEIKQNLNVTADSYALSSAKTLMIYNYWNYQQNRNIWPLTYDSAGKQITPAKDQYVGEGDFSMNFKVKGKAGGNVTDPNAQYHVNIPGMSGNTTTDVKLRVVIEPNSVWGDSFYTSSTGSRKVTLYLSDGKYWFTGTGTLTRQAGGLDNQTKYTQNPPESLGEKYGVDATD